MQAQRTTTVDLVLVQGAVIFGSVLLADGTAAERVTVRAQPDDRPRFEDGPFASHRDDVLSTMVSVEDDGSFVLRGIAPGNVTLVADSRDAGKARTVVQVRTGERVQVDLELSGRLRITGRVLHEDGRPFVGATVWASGLSEAQTDEEGRFTLDRCEDQPYTVYVNERRGTLTCAQKKSAVPGGEEIVLVVPDSKLASAYLKGTVRTYDGSSLRGAEVFCSVEGSVGAVRAKTGFFGGFKVGPVPPGEIKISVLADGYPWTRFPAATTSPGETVSLGDLKLKNPGHVKMSFRAWKGTQENLALQVRDQDDEPVFTRHLSADPERRDAVNPGSHTAVVIRDGESVVTVPFDVVAGQESEIEIPIPRGDE